jgi:GNAT superfamily N-acetyltransferase
MNNQFSFLDVTRPSDRLLLPWLDLYETAFPANERILISDILKILQNQESTDNPGTHISAILDNCEKFIGMAMYQLPPTGPAGILWYMAVVDDQRGRGLGSQFYNFILSKLDPEIYKAMIFEVEIPAESVAPSDAAKRIEFYQKNGAMLLSGISYLQNVGWHQNPIPMHIMIHPFQPMDATLAYDLAHETFGNAIQKTGPLSLD